MAEKLIPNAGRQSVLTFVQAIKGSNIETAGAALPIGSLPRDALVLRGAVKVVEAFAATTKVQVGTAADSDLFGDIDLATLTDKPLTVPASMFTAGHLLATPSGLSATGLAYVVIEYVTPDRATEMFPG